MMMNTAQRMAIFGPMRLPFLVLPPVCVLLGAATAVWSGSKIDLTNLLLAFFGALSAHISVNALNEYDDFKSGLDLVTQPTPFSGGSKTLPEYPEKAHVALKTGIITLIITTVIGLYFLFSKGLWLLPLGVLGLITVVVYTRWLTKNPFLCLIAPGLGFGIFMVMGTDFVLTGSYSRVSFVASLVPFFLVSDLLLLNQFPDVDADKGIGRRHLPITIGRRASVKVYIAFLTGAYIAILAGYTAGILPFSGLLGLASAVLAVPTIMGVLKYAEDIPRLIPYMGMNVVINIITPLTLAIGLFIGS
jgi:1,4-dihydroxy-2-naphthoate octaprenyltransferase